MARPPAESPYKRMAEISRRRIGEKLGSSEGLARNIRVTNFDLMMASLSDQKPTDSKIVSGLINSGYLNGLEVSESTIQCYRKALVDKGESLPLARDLYNVRMMKDQVNYPETKYDLQSITAKLILGSGYGGNMRSVREALGGNSQFIAANQIVDMMILDLSEKYPHVLDELNEQGKALSELISGSESFNFTYRVAEKWLEIVDREFNNSGKFVFDTGKMAYTQKAIEAYCEYKTFTNRKDPRGRANEEFRNLSKDLGSFIVQASTGQGTFYGDITVEDIIDNGKNVLLN